MLVYVAYLDVICITYHILRLYLLSPSLAKMTCSNLYAEVILESAPYVFEDLLTVFEFTILQIFTSD